MRQRLIRPGFFSNEHLGVLPALTRILFAGLWCLADREGRLEDRPLRIKTSVLPYDSYDVDAGLNQLQASGFIHRYEVEGERYIEIVKFSKNQWPHHKEQQSVIPKPRANPRKAQGKPEASPKVAHPLTGSTGPTGPTGSTVTGSTGSTVLPPSAVLVPLKAKSWTAEACEDWSEASGGVAPGGRIGKALKPLVERVSREKALTFEAAWESIRPYWRRFCESPDRKFGPQAFAENPKRVIETAQGKGVGERASEALSAYLESIHGS